MRRLRDKVVVLTGASSGIGRATALALASEGCVLHLIARRESLLAEVRAEVEERGAQATIHPLDVRDDEGFARVTETVLAAHGGVDVLINNAGVGPLKPFLETSDDDWVWTLDTNVRAMARSTRAFLPSMLERGSGTIVNMASLAGLVASSLAAYSTSKFAVVGMSEALLIEFGDRGIDVIAVCPGFVATQMAEASIAAGRVDTDVATRVRELMARRGVAPEVVARDIVEAILRPRFLVYSPPGMRLLHTTHKLVPGWVQAILRRVS